MKIVHIITRLILGGAQENTLLTCEGLQRKGYDVTLITGPALGPEGELMTRAKRGGYKVVELGCLRRAVNPLLDIRCYIKLRKLIREINPDIVHTHSAKAGILGRQAAAVLRKKNSESGCCCGLGKFRNAQLASCARPVILHTIHGLAFHRYQSSLINRLYIAIEKHSAKQTDAFISVAQAMTEQAVAAGLAPAEKFTCIYSGMETAHYLTPPGDERKTQLRNDYNIPDDAIVIATVARLFKLKGHKYIIEAARRIAPDYPNVIWLFIGDGAWRDKLKQQINGAKLEKHFRFTGLVSPQKVGELLHISNILLHCSLREGLARALPQAMLCGIPVISFDVDGAAEVVFNDQTGYLVPPLDIDALVTAQEKLINDANLRRRMGLKGQEKCRKMFDNNLMVDNIEQLYRFLTG